MVVVVPLLTGRSVALRNSYNPISAGVSSGSHEMSKHQFSLIRYIVFFHGLWTTKVVHAWLYLIYCLMPIIPIYMFNISTRYFNLRVKAYFACLLSSCTDCRLYLYRGQKTGHLYYHRLALVLVIGCSLFI